MNEKNIEPKESEIAAEISPAQETDLVEKSAPRRNQRRLFISASILALLLTVGLIAWYLLSPSNRQAGKPVPAPRSAIVDQPTEDMTDSGRQTLTIAPEQMTRAGIKTEIVGEQLALEGGTESVASTGVVQANAYRETPVTSLIGGVVRRVIPELGETVQNGQTVAVVFSDEFAAAQSRYVALLTEADNARRNYERSQKLVRINQPGRAELDSANAQLKTNEAQLEEMKMRYQRTGKLVQIGAASREELEQDRTKLRAAEAGAVEARARLVRAKQLLDINPATRSESEEALNKLRGAESEIASIRQKLILYGASPKRISSLRSASQITSEIAVPAPASGTVTSRTVNQGEVIEANKELFRVTDLSSVWVIAQVYEKDLRRLRTGSGASVTTDAYPDKVFRGHITYIDPSLNEKTRTAQIRIELENPERVLKIGMYVRAAFGALGQAEQTAPTIAASAVQNLGNGQVVFVVTGEPNIFEMRGVRLGGESNGKYQVLEGLNVGDKIVTEGSFLLRAEWLKQHPGNQ
ncbi:MAG: efflux RND transporter periplasmic adaptor subunit [Pyrinomonadaceae bacterium]